MVEQILDTRILKNESIKYSNYRNYLNHLLLQLINVILVTLSFLSSQSFRNKFDV